MRRRFSLAAVALSLLAASGTGAAQEADANRSPQSVLDSLTTTAPFHRMHWGVAVLDQATGESILLHNGHRLFSAASTVKLVTAAAALDLLGPGFRFATEVVGAWGSDGVADHLRVMGTGDPTMATPFFSDPLAPLDSLADSLAAAGLRRVAGPLVIDQSAWDSVGVFPAWEAFDLDWYYAAPVAPFAVMAGAYEVVVTPGAPGEPATVRLPHGDGLVGVDGAIRTVPGDDDWDDVLRRLVDVDSLVLRGTIGSGAGPDTSWIAQTQPGRTAGRAFRRALERAGIQVEGPVEVRHAPGGSAAGPDVTRVVWRSPPLQDIIGVALARSDNWTTEQILKAMAAHGAGQGSWSSGRSLLTGFLTETVGIPGDAFSLRDGSGLTPQGLLAPEAVAALLRFAAEQPWSAIFRAGLARPGEPEGTLDDRLLDYPDRVAAKTGTLRNVNALSGYLRTRSGRTLVFSILTNGSGRPSWQVQPALDAFVTALLESE